MKINKLLSLLLAFAFLNISAGDVLAVENVNEKSYGEQMFEGYISTLPQKYVQILLEDCELVETMKQDSYWIEETNRFIISPKIASTRLPLDSYPDGSYYTQDGGPCTTCHDIPCTYNVPAGYDSCYNPKTGGPGNCILYNNSIQCKAFAEYVYKVYNSRDIANSAMVDVSDYTDIPKGDEGGAEIMSELFYSMPIGSCVRVHRRGEAPGYNHSFIISARSGSGLTIYDANRIGNCKVGNRFLSWSTLADKYDIVVAVWRGSTNII